MDRWKVLATYNAEVARGIMHTPEWKNKMHQEQLAFDAEQNSRRRAEGLVQVAPNLWTQADSHFLSGRGR